MKKLYFVRTNAYDCIISDDGESRRVICDVFAGYDDPEAEARKILELVEDDNTWDSFDEELDELIGDAEVLAEREW